MSQIEDRAVAGRQVLAGLPAGTVYGEKASAHTFWLFPILTDARDELMRHLWQVGFDGATGATSLCAVEPPQGQPERRARAAEEAMARVLYLPVYAAVSPPERQRLVEVLLEGLRIHKQSTEPRPLTMTANSAE